MKPDNLGDFLRDQTGILIDSKADGLEHENLDFQLTSVSLNDAKKIRSYIRDFYNINNFEIEDKTDSISSSMIFQREREYIMVTFSYFPDSQNLMVSTEIPKFY
ncbi:MAG: hypothetical protein WC867_08595 [Candidatus Pacearchaeota archaeon]|jgi:hypothetical protein